MKQFELECLHKLIITQEEYPGNVCPTESNLVRFITGSLSETEREKMRDHFLRCHCCTKAASKLESAHSWFQENESLILGGFAEKATRTGLQAWASCRSPHILEEYATDAISDIRVGAVFHKCIESHLDQCPGCHELGTPERTRLGETLVMELGDLRGLTTWASVKTLREQLMAI